jgi:predicted DNA-binding transcriptional regulator YafY
MRTFRLDRVSNLEVGTGAFKRPAGFDARSYMREHMPFVQSEYQIDVWIDMPIEQVEQSIVPWRVSMETQDGGTRLRCGRDRLEMFAAMLLTTGRRVVVHRPEEMRKTFRELARQALQAAEEMGSESA